MMSNHELHVFLALQVREDVIQSVKHTRSLFGDEVKRRIMLGTYALSAGYYDAYYGKAQKARRLIRDKTLEILASYPMIMLPTTPRTAFGLGTMGDDPVALYLEDIYTISTLNATDCRSGFLMPTLMIQRIKNICV